MILTIIILLWMGTSFAARAKKQGKNAVVAWIVSVAILFGLKELGGLVGAAIMGADDGASMFVGVLVGAVVGLAVGWGILNRIYPSVATKPGEQSAARNSSEKPKDEATSAEITSAVAHIVDYAEKEGK